MFTQMILVGEVTRSLQLENEEDCPLNLTGKNLDLVVATANANFGLVLALFSWTYYLVFVCLYLLRRRSSPYLQQRLLPFVLVVTFGFAYEGVWAIREFIGRHDFPCVISDVSLQLTNGVVVIPVVLRVYLFYRRVAAYKLYSKTNFVNNLKENYIRPGHTSFILDKLEQTENSNVLSKIIGNVQSTIEAVRKASDVTAIQAAQTADSNVSPFSSNDVGSTPEEKAKQQRKLRTYQIISSARFGYSLFAISSIILATQTYIELEEVFPCTGCENLESRQRGFLVSALLYLLVVVTSLYSFWQIWNEPDPLHIKSELGWMLSLASVGVILFTLAEAFFEDVYLDGTIYWGYILMVTYIVTFFVMVPLQIHKSYIFDNNSDDQRYDLLKFLPWFNAMGKQEKDASIRLDDIMKSESMSKQFKSHCAKEQCLENLYFWVEARDYAAKHELYSTEEKRYTFCFLYDIFIESKAQLSVNISGKMRADVKTIYDMVYDSQLESEQEVQKIEQLLPKDALSAVQTEVQSLLVLGPLLRFKQTKEYEVMRI